MRLLYHSQEMPSGRSADHVVAVDLGGTKVAIAAVDSRGRIRERHVETVDTSSAGAVLDQLVRLVKSTAAAGSAHGAGVAVPGLVRRDGTVWAPNLPGWDAFPLARLMRHRLRMPVHVESDRNAVVLGESWRGAARGRHDVIVLIVGTGIGAGIISGGHLVRGAHELSGCAGWLVVADEQNEFSGTCGSLEALVAGPALGRAFGGETLAAATAARDGDLQAIAIFRKAGRLLGYAIANLISLFDPEIVVLTGGASNAADLFLDELRKAVAERAQPLSAPKVEIAVSTLQADANLLGVARLALEIGDNDRPHPRRERKTVRV